MRPRGWRCGSDAPITRTRPSTVKPQTDRDAIRGQSNREPIPTQAKSGFEGS